jgi:MoxR-like ATPase
MNDQLFSNFQAFRGSLNLSFLERTEIIDGLLASLITKQNCFLFGLPGTGKSELVRSAAQGFMGNKFFSYLLSPTTDPSELYGPVAISKLLEDEYTRDVKGYLPDTNVAFLDELFRGSSAVLNSLLQLLNERTFNNGRELIKTDIQSVVAATNSFPTEESLQAFTDRFLFRPTVEGLKRPVNKRKLYEWAVSNTRPEVQSELTSSDLKELQKECEKIEISDEFLDIFSETIEMLNSRGLIISDRRRVQIIKFLKGWAVVQGDSEVLPEHLHSTLKHIVYQTPEDISVIKEVVDQCVPTAEKYFREVQKAANGVMHEFASLQSKPVTDINSINVRIKTMKEYLQDLEIVSRRAEDAMDSGKLKLSPNMRVKAGKICQELTNNIDRVASAISRYQS